MLTALKRNGIVLGGTVACGIICVMARPFLITGRGASGPSMLLAESPISAVAAVVACVALATIVAVAVGRATNAAVGLFCLGAGFFAPLAFRLATVREIAFTDGATSRSLIVIGVETALVALLVLAAVIAMFRFAGPLPDIQPEDDADPPSPWGPEGLLAAAAGAIIIPAVWILGRSPMSGQMLGATIIGGMLAGLAGRFLRVSVQPMLLFVAPAVFGAVTHIVAGLLVKGDLADAYIDRALRPVSLAMPLDYAAGALMGVAMGLGWARSFLHHEEGEATEPDGATAA